MLILGFVLGAIFMFVVLTVIRIGAEEYYDKKLDDMEEGFKK